MSLAGDPRATDPVCHLSPHHHAVAEALSAAAPEGKPFVYRRMAPRRIEA
jgi:pyrroloquinoline quinone biosynthesis protein E